MTLCMGLILWLVAVQKFGVVLLSNVRGFIAAVVDGVLICIHFSKILVDRAVGACCSEHLLQKLAVSLQQEIIVDLCAPTGTCVRAD